MHGYFMDLKAYQKLYSAVNPFAFDKYRKGVSTATSYPETEKAKLSDAAK